MRVFSLQSSSRRRFPNRPVRGPDKTAFSVLCMDSLHLCGYIFSAEVVDKGNVTRFCRPKTHVLLNGWGIVFSSWMVNACRNWPINSGFAATLGFIRQKISLEVADNHYEKTKTCPVERSTCRLWVQCFQGLSGLCSTCTFIVEFHRKRIEGHNYSKINKSIPKKSLVAPQRNLSRSSSRLSTQLPALFTIRGIPIHLVQPKRDPQELPLL